MKYGRHVEQLRRCHCAYVPTSNTASHDNHEKINSWVSVWRPLGLPELCFYLLYNSDMSLRCFFGGTLNSVLFSHNHSKVSSQHESDTTSDVTRLFLAVPICLPILRLGKKHFSLTVCKKKSAMLPSKAETLLLPVNKNLTYKNSVSVAL